jgi:hypothetical protein
MLAVFHNKKVKPAVKKIRLPVLFDFCCVMLFNATNNGTKPMSSKGASQVFGGQAIVIKMALSNAKR